MVIQIMLLLSLLLVTSVVCKDKLWEELVSIDTNFDHINIYSEIPGSILFRASNKSSRLTVKSAINNGASTVEGIKSLPTSTCDINTYIQHGTVNIKVLPRIPQPPTKEFQYNSGFTLMYSYCLTLCILVSIHGWRSAITYGLLLSSVCVFANVCLSNITRIDIVVEYPENHTFKTVSVYQRNGTVRIPNQMTSTNSKISCGNALSSNVSGCPSCCHGNGVCGHGNQCHCDEGFDEKTHCKMKITPRHTVYLNPIDQRIIHVQLPGGRNTTLYGRKTSSGSVRNIKSFRTIDRDGQNSNIFMAKMRKIGRVITASGTTISFDWKSKCSVHVTVIFNKGQGQLDQDVLVCKFKQHKKQTFENSPVEDNILPPVERSQRKSPSRLRSKDSAHDHGAFIKIPVEIRSCNEPDSSAEVSASVIGQIANNNMMNKYLGSLSLYPGVYYIKLPLKPVSSRIDMEMNVCNSLTHSADHLCKYASANYFKFQNHICKKVKSSMKVLSGVTRAHVIDVMSTCESSFQTVLSFCKEFYANIENHCNIDNVMFYDSFVPGNVSVKVAATFPGNFSVYSEPFSLRIKENEPFSVSVRRINDIRPKPRFIGFSVNPRDPRPFQRYNVTINYACASSTTKVDMRIMGSDNYHNNVTCHGVRDCNCCVLHVAGGAAHVMDKVLVTLNDPLTQTITTREIAVLF